MRKSIRSKYRKEPFKMIYRVPLHARIAAAIQVLRCRVRQAEFKGLTAPVRAEDIQNLIKAVYDVMDFADLVIKNEEKVKYQAIASESPCDLGYALGALDVIYNVEDLLYRRVGLSELIITDVECRYPRKGHPMFSFADDDDSSEEP